MRTSTSMSQPGGSFAVLQQKIAALWPACRRNFKPGLNLTDQGAPVSSIFFVTQGTIKASFIERSGREIITNLHPATCVIGADAALLESPSLITATTISDCEIYVVATRHFRELLQSNADFSFHMNRSMARETFNQTRAVIDASCGDARLRLVNLLRPETLAGYHQPPNKDLSASVLLKKSEIAKLLAITPEHLSRLIRRLKRDGILDRSNRKMSVVKEGPQG